jgi:hypothetical protein
MSSQAESLITHPREQAALAAQLPWWGWAMVALGFVMAGLMVWYLWPRRPRPDMPRDSDGRPLPPWKRPTPTNDRPV